VSGLVIIAGEFPNGIHGRKAGDGHEFDFVSGGYEPLNKRVLIDESMSGTD